MRKTFGQVLQEYMDKADIKDQELAAQLQLQGFETRRETISRWRSGKLAPPSRDTVLAIATALRLPSNTETYFTRMTDDLLIAAGYVQEYHTYSREERQEMLEPRFALPKRVPHFKGRTDEIETVKNALQPGETITLAGPGGIGKTALAAEVLWDLHNAGELKQRFPDGVIHHDFYVQPDILTACEAIVRFFEEEPKPNLTAATSRALSCRKPLIVLEGAEKADDLFAFLRLTGRAGVLVTTRNPGAIPDSFLPIGTLRREQSIAVLEAWAPICTTDNAATTNIARLVGDFPLALYLAGHYMHSHGQNAREYLAWLETTPLAALHHGQHQRQSVPILMERSVQALSLEAQATLNIIGALALKPFAVSWLAVALERSDFEVSRHLGELVNYGLLLHPDNYYQVSHPLIHTYARETLPPAPAALDRLAAHFNTYARQQRELGPAGFARLDPLRPHLLRLLETCVARERWQPVTDLVWAIASYLDLCGYSTERVQALDHGLAAARALGHRRNEGAFLGNLGNACADLGRLEDAITYHEQALALAREIGDRRGEGADLGNLGTAYAALGRLEDAITYYEQALALAREIGDRRGEGAHLGNLGLAYADLGRLEDAITYHEQALALAREIGDRRGEGNRLGNLGNAYYDLGRREDAITYHEQALAIAREIGDRRMEGTVLGNLGAAYYSLGRLEDALTYHEQALALAREIGDRRGEGRHLGNLGAACADLGRLEDAITYHQQALEIAREIGDRRGEGIRLGNLGIAYKNLGRLEDALTYYKQALALDRETGDRRGEGRHLGNLGVAYRHLDQIDKAIDHFKQALSIAQEIGDKSGESNYSYNLACAHALQHQPQTACTWLRNAIAIDPKYRPMAQDDTDFDPVRDHPCFQALVAGD